MPTCDDTTLADFELPRIDHRERVLAFVDDLPSFFATCHAKVARISYGKFEHRALLRPASGARVILGFGNLQRAPCDVQGSFAPPIDANAIPGRPLTRSAASTLPGDCAYR